MRQEKKPIKFPSELRYDLVSKDWVLIATGRAKRPDMFKSKRQKVTTSVKKCPFCQIQTQNSPVLVLTKAGKISSGSGIPKNWMVVVVPNKYPAVLPFDELNPQKEGDFYEKINAVGFHEVIISRDHNKSLAQLSVTEIEKVINAYHLRYLALMKRRFVNHIAIFHNHGREAGASVPHPHSQLMTMPLIDSDLKKALLTAKKYEQAKKKCLYCQMNAWELKTKKRIIFTNKEFLVLCPFASKVAFEVIISPKRHSAYFEKITPRQKHFLAEAFKAALWKLFKGLNDPPYNFYLHTAPCDGKRYDYYHWHWTILPKISIWAGFELGAKMEISTIEPEKAAEYLRKQ